MTAVDHVWNEDRLEFTRNSNFSYATRPTSSPLIPFRFTGSKQPAPMLLQNSWSPNEPRTRKSSSTSRSKAKDSVAGKESLDSNNSTTASPLSSAATTDTDSFAAINITTSSSYTHSSGGFTPLQNPSKPQRGSLLVAASDALSLGFRFGRRRKSVRQPTTMPIILPDVIEISAPKPDQEAAERERLRNEAAHAIGLVADIPSELVSHGDITEEEDEGEETERPQENGIQIRNAEVTPDLPQSNSHSHSFLPHPIIGRHRAGSMPVHSRTRSNSAIALPVPSFPSTPSALTAFTQSSSSLLKFYSPTSLRIFALSKQWKTRFMVLSSPSVLVSRTSSGSASASYLHLFKTSGAEERELERLEINADSVVFVAEEDVGGRRHVIKVGGIDVGALKRDLNQEEAGRTMWFLHADQGDAQKWITSIKNVIFGQKTMRAGLGHHSFGGTEPQGDMDVMLSMRAQGIITSPVSNNNKSVHDFPSPSLSPPSTQTEFLSSSASSHRSIRSVSTMSKSVSSSAVSTLKGLFTSSSRSRSGSRATSIEREETSFSSVGHNMMGMPEQGPSFPRPVTTPQLPASDRFGLERKIVSGIQESPDTSKLPKDRAARTLSLGALSLQPPPRSKRWTSSSRPFSPSTDSISHSTFSNHERAGTEPVASGKAPSLSEFPFGTPEQKPRAPSMSSVSTVASGEHSRTPEQDRSSINTKRSSTAKRWSRQLPQRLTPPSGPPPAPPDQSRLQVHPYAAERPSSRTSSHSGASSRSVVSSLPSFSKRASGGSTFSVNTTSTSHSNNVVVHSRASSSHRSSMPPPPRPAPTFALPPAPSSASMYEASQAPASQPPPIPPKSSLRDRALRLSLMAPKPPPSTVLPPRPDEQPRRSSSLSRKEPAPVSPSPPESPFPAPNGPLPPTPPQSTAPSRHTSLKQRLRILSAPSPTSTSPMVNPGDQLMEFGASQPGTPIAEKIVSLQSDSFLQMYSPSTPRVRHAPLLPETYPEIPLSPAPRRSSKQISLPPEVVEPPVETEPEPESTEIESDATATKLSETPPRDSSVISLGIFSM
ncbi:hypothetical protein C8J56DRAFT_911693 [Mycena floridula]|nr:hypothetical protein C8J56DRAFT_911693 [Mycena floridula]